MCFKYIYNLMLLIINNNLSCFPFILDALLASLDIGITNITIVTCGYFYTFLSTINCDFILTNKDPYNRVISDQYFDLLVSNLLYRSTSNARFLYIFACLENFDYLFYSKVTSLCDKLSENIYFAFICLGFNRFNFCRISSRCFPYMFRLNHTSLITNNSLYCLIRSLFISFNIQVFKKMLSISSPFSIGYYIYKILLLSFISDSNYFLIEAKLVYLIQCNNINFYSVSDIVSFFRLFYLLKYGELVSI
ncbi:hypothetical protein [Candidatus Vidania fulgoroideorum]